jgi:spore germination protein YaaH
MRTERGRSGVGRALWAGTIAALVALASVQPAAAGEREVFGYLPSWNMDYEFPRWDLLTTVAYFDVGMDEYGVATSYGHWGTDAVQDLVDEAHAEGVRLVVTITNFNDLQIVDLLGDPGRRATAIETCLSLIAMHGADGVNIDFESVSPPVKDEFVSFMADLKDAVAATQPGGTEGHVTLAGPAIDWTSSYDYDQLLLHTDGIFIMGYDYHWGSSDPGPTAPYADSETWGTNYSLTWTVEDYLQWGGAENRSKIILGLPLFGHVYRVADESVPGVNVDKGYTKAWSTGGFETQAATYGSTWSEAGAGVYLHREYEGHLVQAWNENLTSIGMKMDLANVYELGGVGFWALGYDEGFEGFWTEVEDQFGSAIDPDPDPDPDPEPAPDVPSDAAVQSDGDEADLGPVPDGLGDDDAAETAEPRAWRGNSRTNAVVTRQTDTGCAGGGAPSPASLLAALLWLGLARIRRRQGAAAPIDCLPRKG